MVMDKNRRNLTLNAIKVLCTHLEENDRSEETVLIISKSIRQMADDLCRGHGEFAGQKVAWGGGYLTD